MIGHREARITERHTVRDFAQNMNWLAVSPRRAPGPDEADELHPEAEIIRVILDNLNTHKPASLYETFPPEEVLRILIEDSEKEIGVSLYT